MKLHRNNHETAAIQATRCRRLWSSVVLHALDDAINEQRRGRNGSGNMRHWCNSRWGRTVLTMAGINPSSAVTDAMVAFVLANKRTSTVSVPNIRDPKSWTGTDDDDDF